MKWNLVLIGLHIHILVLIGFDCDLALYKGYTGSNSHYSLPDRVPTLFSSLSPSLLRSRIDNVLFQVLWWSHLCRLFRRRAGVASASASPGKVRNNWTQKTMPIHELESKKKIGSVKSQDLVDVVASAPAFDGLESFETLVFYWIYFHHCPRTL